MRRGSLSAVLAVSFLLLVLGCGGDEGSPNPVTGVSITPDRASLEIGNATGITATVTGGDSKNLTWYVNGIENGNPVYGAITQNSLVTYTAPDSLPAQTTVVIVAIAVEDTSMKDSCSVDLEFTKIFVDAGQGNNDTGTGCINLPVKTITKGLDMAEKGMTVLVRPGVYDRDNGEMFQMAVKESISLVGMDWESCIIRGHWGGGGSNKMIWVTGRHPVLRKFTLEQEDPGADPWQIALYIQAIDGLIDSIRISERADYSLVRFVATIDMVVQNCRFVMDDDDREKRAFEVINENYGAVVRNCTMSGFDQAMNVSGLNDMLIESCTITDSATGIILCAGSLANNPNPDLGGGASGSTGGNTITGYTDYGLRNQTTNAIYAKFNTWNNNPPQAGVDYSNEGDGSIVVD